MKERREKIFFANPDFVLCMCRMLTDPPGYIDAAVATGLPDDAKVVDVRHDWERQMFALKVQSASFPVVPAGEPTPVAQEQFEWKRVIVKINRTQSNGVVEVDHNDIQAACQKAADKINAWSAANLHRPRPKIGDFPLQFLVFGEVSPFQSFRQGGTEFTTAQINTANPFPPAVNETVEPETPPKSSQRGYEFL